MRNDRLKHGLPALLLLAAAAATAGASDVIAARQAHYREIGKAFKAINDQLKSPAADVAVIQANAAVITRLGRQQKRETWFPAGSHAGQGLQTAAKPLIWQNRADFDARRGALARVSAGYSAIAGTGDLEAITAATADIGKVCKGCHETYRDQDRS